MDPKLSPGRQRLETFGDFVDKSISKGIERRFEAPLLEGCPESNVWYRLPVENGLSGDGSEYHIYIKKGTNDKLVIFLSGGGVAWNEYTAARPVTGGAKAAGLPNYYWNNLRPMTQIMNINNGITELNNPMNPFNDWNFIVIPYATGDFHVGNNDFAFTDESGEEKLLHFHGLKNFQEGLSLGKTFFETPEQILIAGDSAGAVAVPAVTPFILEDYYPECRKVTLFSDSGQLLYKKWHQTAKEIWKAPDSVVSPLHTSNITLDWYRHVYSIWGDRLTYLYAGSPRDYLLSAYYNDVLTHNYESNRQVQEKYRRKMKGMLKELKEITPNFGIFLYKWPNLRITQGGTVHTAVRHLRFYFQTSNGLTMAEWLGDAVNGKVYDANLDYMD